MKKIIAIMLSLIIIPFIISGCKSKEIISQKPMELRFTPAHTEREADVCIVGDYILPIERTIAYPEKYEVRYKITYEDGSTSSEWQTVDKETYEKARDKLPP